MYLTGDEKRKIKYAGLELSPETEKKEIGKEQQKTKNLRILR